MRVPKKDLAVSKRLYHLLYNVAFDEAAALFATLDPHVANCYRTSVRADSVFLVAARRGRLDIVNRCALQPNWNVNQCDARGWTALCMAAARGQWAIVFALLQARALPNLATPDGVTPLYFVAMSGRVDVFDALVRAGAEPFRHRYMGATALWIAARFGHAEIVRRLLSFQDVPVDETSTQLCNQTPLWVAAANGHAPVVELLLNRGARYDVKCTNGLTPLLAAVCANSPACVGAMTRFGVPADPAPTDPTAPITVAVFARHLVVLDLLLQRGVDLSDDIPRNRALADFAIDNRLPTLLHHYQRQNRGVLLPRQGRARLNAGQRGRVPRVTAAARGS